MDRVKKRNKAKYDIIVVLFRGHTKWQYETHGEGSKNVATAVSTAIFTKEISKGE